MLDKMLIMILKKLDATDDDIEYGQEQVQELINKFNKLVETKTQEKEKELLSV